MTRKVRLVYFFFVVLIFLVITPVLVAYIYGYRYDWDLKRLRKTGSLYVATFPKKADIYLNGKKSGIKAPNSFNGLLERNYRIRAEKEGYEGWEKELRVEPGLVTKTDLIYLFPEDLKERSISEEHVVDFKISPDHDQAVYLKEGALYLLDLDSGKSQELLEKGKATTSELTKLSWSADSKRVLTRSSRGEFYIVQPSKPGKAARINLGIVRSFEDIHWDSDNKDAIYFLGQDGYIYHYDLLEKQSRLVLNSKVLAYTVFNTKVYYLLEDKNIYRFDKTDGSIKQITRQSLDIEATSEALNQFRISKEEKIAFVSNRKKLYLIDDSFSEGWEELAEGVEEVVWQGGSRKIAYRTLNEIWVYYVEQKEAEPRKEAKTKELIERTSEEIRELNWFHGYEYLMVIGRDKLKAIELDERDRRNVYDLMDISSNSEVEIEYSGDNERLYIWNEGLKSVVLENDSW